MYNHLILKLDKKAQKNLKQLRIHYGSETSAAVIRKALALLSVAKEIDDTQGELIARKGNKESRIVLR